MKRAGGVSIMLDGDIGRWNTAPIMTNATMTARAEAAGRKMDATMAACVSAKLGCEVRLDHYETEQNGWPVPVFAVPTARMDDARRLGLCVMEWDQ